MYKEGGEIGRSTNLSIFYVLKFILVTDGYLIYLYIMYKIFYFCEQKQNS